VSNPHAPQVPDHTPTTRPWKDAGEIDAAIERMAAELQTRMAERGVRAPLLVGIHTGGVWVAERLQRLLGIAEPLGTLDISFYRDDFTRIGMHPQVRPSNLPVAVEDRHLILVDDVLQTGRTIRAALNVLFDYGRPKSVTLAALAERDGRQLPIEPNVVGFHARLGQAQQIKLVGPDPLTMVLGDVPTKDKPAAGGTP
jgi:pyrimidine operon attenuation protein/uracil phosphoribosyltransferase